MKKIIFKKDCHDINTKEEYKAKDVRLLADDVADRIVAVNNGAFAEEVIEESKEDASESQNTSFEKMKKDELVAYAEERGIEIDEADTKAMIIEKLEANDL